VTGNHPRRPYNLYCVGGDSNPAQSKKPVTISPAPVTGQDGKHVRLQNRQLKEGVVCRLGSDARWLVGMVSADRVRVSIR